MIRIKLIAFGIIVLLFLGSATILSKNQSPEQLILGKWEEVSWSLERLDVDSSKHNNNFLDYQKKELYSNLMLHKAEEWEFFLEKKLTLRKGKSQINNKELEWYLKGRGNILELKYGNKNIETYQIHKLTNDSLVIYYNFDLQMRGSVKITFKKNDAINYAQKI